MGAWFCTDSDNFQYCRKCGNGKFNFIEIFWLDLVEGDDGFPDKEYIVKTAYIDLKDYNTHDKECAIYGYYDSLIDVYKEYKKDSDQIIAECIFEQMDGQSAATYGMMTREEAEKFIKDYIKTF